MRVLALDTIRAVEEQMQKQLEPVVATQQMVQSIVDAQQPMLNAVAHALEDFARAAQVVERAILPRPELLDAFKKMQELVDATKISFDLPELKPLIPMEFGEMCVEVMEDEQEMIPVFVPDRQVTAVDRRLIAEEVVQILKDEGLVVAEKKQLKLLTGPQIQRIVIVRPEKQRRMQIVINEDYENPIAVGFAKCWRELLLIADRAELTLDQIKSTFDYFNTNIRCALYTKTNYQKTQILQIENGFVIPRVDIAVISEKALKTRMNKIT